MGIVKEPLPPSSIATTASSLPAQGMKQNKMIRYIYAPFQKNVQCFSNLIPVLQEYLGALT